MRNLIYRLYEGRLARTVSGRESRNDLPKHVAVMLDGNRRWAKNRQLSKVAHGHAAGAQKIFEFLGWCDDLGIGVVTLYLLSTDNVKNRDSDELTDLLEIIGGLADNLSATRKWRVRLMGVRNLLPPELLTRLEAAEQATAGLGGTQVNLAVGYGGRNEISDAVADILRERAAAGETLSQVAEEITPELISQHLYTGGMPDPDLIIRTSGEQRLSGFLLWQSASSELYFEEALWPDFRKVDFLRALRAFESRNRRFGA
jgi:short-chain Z-isoprenyl diphosphate synthase